MLDAKSADIVTVTLDWLAHHVLSEDIEVSIFEGSLLVSGVTLLVLVGNFDLELLELSGVEGNVADDITEHLNSLSGITLHDLQAVAGVLSV